MAVYKDESLKPLTIKNGISDVEVVNAAHAFFNSFDRTDF